MAINYGLETLIHDAIEAVTQWRAAGGEQDDRGWRGRTAAADACASVLTHAAIDVAALVSVRVVEGPIRRRRPIRYSCCAE